MNELYLGMAIRIRKIDGRLVALCARVTIPVEGDIYLHDGIHHALSEKFGLDYESMGFLKDAPVDEISRLIIEKEEAKCICPVGEYGKDCPVHKDYDPALDKNFHHS